MRITLHCSALANNKRRHDIKDIRAWHKKRGFHDVGNHFVITDEGLVQMGRDVLSMGAHVRGNNKNNIGICLTGLGPHDFTSNQGMALYNLVLELMVDYDVRVDDVRGHYEFDEGKDCPNINMPIFRASIEFIMSIIKERENGSRNKGS